MLTNGGYELLEISSWSLSHSFTGGVYFETITMTDSSSVGQQATMQCFIYC